MNKEIESADRAMPHALGPEKSILSSMMQDSRDYVARAVEAGCTSEWYYLPSHGVMFSVLVEMFNKGLPVELVELVQTLTDRSLLDQVGGASAVYDLFSYAPHAANFGRHLSIVRDKFLLRQSIRQATQTIQTAYDSPEEITEFLDRMEEGVLGIRGSIVERTADLSVSAAVEEWASDFSKWVKGEVTEHGLTTGLSDLDRLVGGWCPTEFILVAARPSKGKTALALNFVNHSAVEEKVPTLVFSMEMSRSKLIRRLIALRSGFDRNNGKPDKGDLVKLQRAATDLKDAPLYIDDRSALTVDAIRARARRMKKDFNIGLIVIDYLGLMKGTSKQAMFSREREVSEISGGLKALAKELGIPVICLAQLNREVEKRGGKSGKPDKPRLADLKDSGSLEADADKVLMIHPLVDDEDEECDTEATDVLVEKNRDGATGRVKLVFRKPLSKFEPRAADHACDRERKAKTEKRWDNQ